ncbi:hypothetical protein [Streptosporangium sp. NPDC000396]|uniref:hypothetical protein n=1 Tax=Streptosporangium sp. NPDC000396 TaxID=3366185 RepID=UPI0036AD5E00
MAEAHRQLARDLRQLHKAIDPYVSHVLRDWQGQTAEAFRKKWGDVVDEQAREELIESCEKVAEILDACVDASRETKRGLYELIRSIVIAIGTGIALSWVSAGLSAAFAYYRAIKAAGTAVGLLRWIMLTFRSLGLAINNLPRISRILSPLAKLATRSGPALTRSPALTKSLKNFDDVFNTRFVSTLASYKKTWLVAFGPAVMGTQMTAQGLSGNSIFNFDITTFAQAARISTAAASVGVAGQSGLAFVKNHKHLWNLGSGVLQGSSGSAWAATLVKSGWDVAESAAWFGGFVATRNTLVGLVPQASWLSPVMQKQLLGFTPTTGFRMWKSLSTPDPVQELPQWHRPIPGNGR